MWSTYKCSAGRNIQENPLKKKIPEQYVSHSLLIVFVFRVFSRCLFMYLKERNHLWDKFSRFSRILDKFAKLNHREKSSENQFAKINPRKFSLIF